MAREATDRGGQLELSRAIGYRDGSDRTWRVCRPDSHTVNIPASLQPTSKPGLFLNRGRHEASGLIERCTLPRIRRINPGFFKERGWQAPQRTGKADRNAGCEAAGVGAAGNSMDGVLHSPYHQAFDVKRSGLE